MKYLILFFVFATQILSAQNFDKANELYRKSNFEAAVAEYEKILATGKESPELYFNLANAYYKLAKVGPSIYYYEKALLLDPNDKDIQNNLKFAQKMQIDAINPVTKSGVDRLTSDFTSMFHYNSWAWITVILAVLFLASFAGYYFAIQTLYKRIYFFAMFAILFLMVISVASALYQKRTTEQERPAIVYVGIAGVKSEPTAEAPDAFILHEGTKVFVLESLDNWKHVSLLDGNDGWIDAKSIRELK